jgi:hypothetical protein
MGTISTFDEKEKKLLLAYLKKNAPDKTSPSAAPHAVLLYTLEKDLAEIALSSDDVEELHVHLQRTSPEGPGSAYIPHLYITCDIGQMTKEGIKQQHLVEEAYKRGGFHEAIGVAFGAEGYGEKKLGFSGKPHKESKTIHDIQAEFTNPSAKSQLMLCEVCEVETRHTTPFFGYPFRCVVNHNGTTRCHGCRQDVDFIARVVVTGQHEHKSYCVSCDESLPKEK